MSPPRPCQGLTIKPNKTDNYHDKTFTFLKESEWKKGKVKVTAPPSSSPPRFPPPRIDNDDPPLWIHPKITAILNAQDDRERKVTWKKTDGSTIFAVRCCFRVTGAISEHYSFVETLNFAMRSSFQRTLALECSCFWRYAFVEPWNLVKYRSFHICRMGLCMYETAD